MYIHIIEDMAFLEGSDALGQRPVLAAEVVGSNSPGLVKYGIELSSILSSRSTKPAALTAQFS